MVKGKIILSKVFLGGHVVCTGKTRLEGWIILLHEEQEKYELACKGSYVLTLLVCCRPNTSIQIEKTLTLNKK
jgi:hypothetical protein